MSKSRYQPVNERGKDEGSTEILRRSFVLRICLLVVAALAGLGGLFARMFYLQVSQYEHYRTRSRGNRIRIKPQLPERGVIYDRHGRALTENVLRHHIVVNPSQAVNIDALVTRLCQKIPITAEEIALFKKRLKQTRRYEYVVLKESIGEDDYYRLASVLHDYPGVEFQASLERYYPYGALLSHVVGYTNRINQEDLRRLDMDEYQGMEYIGRAGIERQYESYLRGHIGMQQIETDVNGNMVHVIDETPARRGADIYLSIDADLQRFVHEQMGEYRGACVVMDPNNGEVLAMVSTPSYDANLFVRGITQRQYSRLLEDEATPLYHRAIKGRYAPGSVVKPMMALAGLHYQLIGAGDKVNCSGHYRIPDSKTKRLFHCWKRSGHGRLDMHHAIAESCDVYFYALGYKLGGERIGEYGRHFSLGEKTGIDLPDEGSGIMPSKAWKEAQYHTPWFIGDTINVSIGQGYLSTTPLQLAQMTCILANDGVAYQPHLLKQLYDPEQGTFFVNEAARQAKPVSVYDASQWREIRQAMQSVMKASYGTAHRVGNAVRFSMAGKSGTVQVISFKDNQRIKAEDLAKEHQDNAMFIAYAPVENPKVAVSVVVERGGGGSSTAAPIAAAIAKYYLGEERAT